MRKTVLMFNIGNTHVTAALLSEGKIVRRVKIATGKIASVRAAWSFISSNYGHYKINSVCIASMVPGKERLVASACRQLFGFKAIIATPGAIKLPAIRYNRWQIGVDRLLVALGAHKKYGRDCIIIDAGTAITIDAVSKKGEFLGGVIVPGISTATLVLERATAKLPLVKVSPSGKIAGHNTKQAISRGIYHGYLRLVDGLVTLMAREQGLKSPVVVVTGGDAKLLVRASSKITSIDANLIFEGLRHFLSQNFISV